MRMRFLDQRADPMHESAILAQPKPLRRRKNGYRTDEMSAEADDLPLGLPKRRLTGDPSVPSLLRQYARTRDPRVRERLVLLHDRMVRYLASRFGLGAGTTLDDLVQVGYIGLC